MAKHFKDVDLAIMMPGANVSHAPYVAMQRVLQTGSGRTIHFHWAGAYSFEGALLPATEEVDQVYQEALLNTDYRRISGLHQFFEERGCAGNVRARPCETGDKAAGHRIAID